ncbi:hypothetical protein QFC19_000438 [Naganishia cerealis]|uniref:Uncharacterized protein n=1 Tax=Naganishia cerealis TaxID=610337 RepID=A0ACC2WMB2_9TREE|nr:hypothetical protein QFC19_000438 [Naganishia cerealis]
MDGLEATTDDWLQANSTAVQNTYAASLVTEFAQRRHVDVTPILKALRLEELELLRLVQGIQSARRRGRARSAALQPLYEKTKRILDSLNALEEPVRTLAIRNPSESSHQKALQQIRSTVHRAALRAFVEHSQGLPFARHLLQRMWDDARTHACVGKADSDVLGMMIKKFRHAEENGIAWRIESDTTHPIAFQAFLDSILSRLTSLQEDIFTLIMDIHVDSGISVESIRILLEKCMHFAQSEWNGRWTPAAFHALMQAYRREGDVRGCIETYRSFRTTMSAAASEEAWNRRNFSTLSWPYEAVLTACLEARMGGATKDKYRPPSNMPELIWKDIQEDGVVPPPRLLAYLIKLAMHSKDLKAAHRLWGIFFPLAKTKDGHLLISRPDIDCYYQYFKLVRQQPFAKGDIVPLRQLVRQLLDSKVTAGQNLSLVRSLWMQVLETALSAPYYDLPLALWVLGRFNDKALTVDGSVIDVTAECLIKYWKAKPRGTQWTREVMGIEAIKMYVDRDRGGQRMPLGVRARNLRSRGATTADWDMISRRLVELVKVDDQDKAEQSITYLPLAKPVARWEVPKHTSQAFHTKVFSTPDRQRQQANVAAPSVLSSLRRGLTTMLELCIVAKPRIGINPYIEHAQQLAMPKREGGNEAVKGEPSSAVILRHAMQGVHRDLFGSQGQSI